MEWIDTTVGEFCPFVYGKAIKKSDQISEGMPVFGSNGVYAFSEKPLVDSHGVIIGRKGSVGKIHLSEEAFWVSDTAYYTNKATLADTYFVYYLLSSLGLENMNTDAAVPGLNRSNAHRLEIKVPKYASDREQLIAPLMKLDNKIQLNHNINQTLEKMAQALFKSWFVDFEPVKAKVAALEAGGSDEDALLAAMESVSGKTTDQLATLSAEQPERYAELRATAAQFPSAMQDSELGEIPVGWRIGTITDLLELNPRRTLKKGTVAPYLDMKNIPTSGHLAEEVVEREMGSGTKFINGDTLLARITPCLENGKTAFVDFLNDGETGWGSTEYIVLRPQRPYPTSLGYFIARNEKFRVSAIQSMTGTSGRQRASASALADLKWITYPLALVECFDLIAGSYLRMAKSHGDQSKCLAKIRDTLLPKLLSGELTLSDIEETQAMEATA